MALLGVFVASGATIFTSKSAHAEFEIQETQVEKGEVEVEYRGAVHWGFPRAEREAAEEAAEEGEGGGALEEEEEGEFLRQSHDLEFQWSITDRWMISNANSADEPLDGDFDFSSIEIEIQYELIEREGSGFGLAPVVAYGFATRGGEADEFEFGPFFELGSNEFLFTGNPLFTTQVGKHKETDGLGFEYGWRAEQKIAQKWGVGVEMFGEIEELAHAGSFNDQQHSIGPTVFYNPGADVENVGGLGDPDDDEIPGESGMEFSFNLGVQFGLTDMTSDTALKFQGALEF